MITLKVIDAFQKGGERSSFPDRGAANRSAVQIIELSPKCEIAKVWAIAEHKRSRGQQALHGIEVPLQVALHVLGRFAKRALSAQLSQH